MSPTSLTLKRLRRQGYAVGIVERWIAQARVRKDLFGCIDLIAAKAGESVLGVQATALSCISARIANARALAELGSWLATGARFQVWGWGKINGRWHPRIVEVMGSDMQVDIVQAPPRRRRKPRYHIPDLFAALIEC